MKKQFLIPNSKFRIHLVGLVLTMVLLIASLGVFSLTASAAEATIIAQGECGAEGSSVQWKYDNTGTLTISGTGEMARYGVGTSPWYDYRDSITSIVIKEGVTTIGRSAFYNCGNMTDVEIPTGVTYIGIEAFANCGGLEIVTIPGSVHTIDNNAFYGCNELTTVKIANGVVSIGQAAFCNSRKLTSVELPESVTSIGQSAFNGCSALESIRIPQGVTEIQDSAFSACTSLKTIEIPDGVTSIGQLVFYKCSALESIKLPKGVTEIQANAFSRCTSLTSIELPEDLTLIGNSAFWGCTALQSIHIPDKVTSIDGGALGGCESLTEIEIPHSVTHIGKNAFNGNINMSKVTVSCTPQFSYDFGDGVTLAYKDHSYTGCICTVCEESYSHLGALSKIVPTEDGKHTATWSCCGVVMVEDHNPDKESYRDLENGTHSFTCTDCGTVTEAHSWEKSACTLCGATCSHSLVENVCTVCGIATGFCGTAENEGGEESVWWTYENGTLIFDGDGAMAEYNLSRPWGAYGDGVTTIVIEEGVTTIADFAFHSFTALESIEIPQGVVKIGVQAFDGCSALKSVEIPDSVTQLGANAFHACTVLESIKLSNGLDMILKGVFENCRALMSIEIPNKVGVISDRAFYNCINLTNVKFSHSVYSMSKSAFEGCTSLTTVTTSCDPQFNYAFGDGVTIQREHLYENGFCTVCETYQPAVDSDSDGYYEISNAGQLFWFANHVNTVDRTASAVLVADIDLENRPWTPIGETGENNKNFRGVFDGQNHTIKGLYVEGTKNGVGFFGEVRTGTVKNFTIYGEVVVNTEVDYVGGVIGSICGVNGETDLERNGAIIQNITSYVNLTAKAHGVGMIGGFVGYANHQSLIENCSWYGTFDAGIYRVDSGAGGFIGKIQENTSKVTIRNCAAYGTIKTNYAGDYNNTATIYMGGFLSFSNTGAKTTLENCLFAGKFERGENLTDKAFLGAFGTLRSVNAIKNCYYLGDGVLEAVHSNSDLKPGSDNVEITSVTKAQLLSGEVAYKLGEHFGQILEGENRQSYPVLGGEAVPSSRFEIYGQQLNIGGDLSMKYYVMGYAPEFNSKGLYMEFSHNGVKTKVYAGEPNADGFYVFVLEGINPQCMGDSIRAKLYYNETEVTSHGCEDGKEYSVEKNLLNLLEKYKDDAALVALINDTLAYGKAASEYKKHDTMTGDYTVLDSSIPDATVTPNGAFTGYTVVFGQVNFIKVSVELADGYTLYLDGTDITTQLVGGIFKTDGIAPTEFDKKFSFEIKNGDTVVQTFAVSVNDYIGAQKDSTTMGNLVKALYNYGVSAEIYNHVANGVGEHTYTYIDNGDGTHDKVCTVCGDVVADNENHTIENHVCTACGAMEIVVSFDSDDYEWKTGDTLYFCRVSRNNQWEEYCFTATVAEDGTVTWTSDKTLYWDGTGEHRLFVSYPCTAVGWDDFMIPTDQSDVDKLKEADCMNARWIGTPTTNVIEFELKHRMAKITVNYVIASQFDLDAPIIAEIYSNAMYCIFRDADGLPIITSVGQYDAWITPYHNANQFTVYVAPGEYNTDGMFKFYVGDAEVQIEITTPGAVTLEEGGEYTFDVKVGQDVFRIAEVSMSDIDSPFGDGWNSETDLKAIGTQAEGKTAWENGDQIIVIFTSPRFGTQYGTLTYDGNVGSWSTDVSFSYLEGEIPTVSAIYAPCYEVVDGNMQLKDGMQLGMTEYISAACSITDETLNISFKGATRNYSRLRIVGLANQTLTVITTGFTPAGATEEASESYTLTTDEDGNADIYGTFAEGATILVQLDETELAQYIFYESTANGMSYALDALSAQE